MLKYNNIIKNFLKKVVKILQIQFLVNFVYFIFFFQDLSLILDIWSSFGKLLLLYFYNNSLLRLMTCDGDVCTRSSTSKASNYANEADSTTSLSAQDAFKSEAELMKVRTWDEVEKFEYVLYFLDITIGTSLIINGTALIVKCQF